MVEAGTDFWDAGTDFVETGTDFADSGTDFMEGGMVECFEELSDVSLLAPLLDRRPPLVLERFPWDKCTSACGQKRDC